MDLLLCKPPWQLRPRGSLSFIHLMKHWLRCGLWFLISMGLGQAAEIWQGVVLISEGRAEGNWKSVNAPPPVPDQWERWEQMEKMTRPEELRRSAVPNAIMMPDASGRSVLAVAPNAGLHGYVVDAGTGMVDLRGAEVEECMVRLAGGGQLLAKDSFLSSFHVAESMGAAVGGNVVVEHCAVTGPFGEAVSVGWCGTVISGPANCRGSTAARRRCRWWNAVILRSASFPRVFC